MVKKNKNQNINKNNLIENNIEENNDITSNNITTNNIINEDNNLIINKSFSKTVIDDNNIILKELLNKQLKNIVIQNKLNFNDIKRISKFIITSIFDENNCSLWTGYITNENNNLKGTYINFYYNKKKIALHRLLYENYIGNINEDDYIKFTCINKGKCCNVNHLKKFSYNKNDIIVNINQNLDNNIKINLNKDNLTIEF